MPPFHQMAKLLLAEQRQGRYLAVHHNGKAEVLDSSSKSLAMMQDKPSKPVARASG
jgi:hypothetical protein